MKVAQDSEGHRRGTMTRPDDWHLHVRVGELLYAVLQHTVQQFGRAIIMPNLKPPVVTVEQAFAYRERILAAVPHGANFEPLMTLYLTDNTQPKEIRKAAESGVVRAVKYYPAGATTNSENGVTNMRNVYAVLEVMEELDMPLCVHGEVTDPSVDVFDREKSFLHYVLDDVLMEFPKLRVVLEHITTKEAVGYVEARTSNVAATITAHHLLMNRNAIFQDGIHPHHYCVPVLKRETHRLALIAAATSGNPKFFLGTDSAPHPKSAKESACGCAGCYTAHAALGLYAEAFDSIGRLNRLEGFASHFGPDFYGLPRNTDTIELVEDPWRVPREYPIGNTDCIIPLRAGKLVQWRVVT
ncbi:MAG: dihydroorotase [Parcubacteria group bacterium 21-54-25]|nr:MAG: dihydroorotase [Parcubacteria group bacterium 21-54-25]HQU08036.1 dihydroorotase [Candidatus Paceibacterota bacterium]